jgi:hypothetical protein
VAEIVQAKSVTWGDARALVKSHKWEENVAALIREWSLAHPDEVVAIDRKTKMLRRERAYGQMFGAKAKHGAHFAEVPVSLYKLMQARVHRDWMNRQEIAEVFFRHFRVGLLNLKSMPDFEK